MSCRLGLPGRRTQFLFIPWFIIILFSVKALEIIELLQEWKYLTGSVFVNQWGDDMADTNKMTHVAVYVDTSGSMAAKMEILNERDHKSSFIDRMLAGSGKVRRKRWDIAMDLWKSITNHIYTMPTTVRTIQSRGESVTVREIGMYSDSELQSIEFPRIGGGPIFGNFLLKRGKNSSK